MLEDDKVENLTSLCERCHALFHGVPRWLFRPFAIGFGVGLLAGLLLADWLILGL